MEAMHVAPVDVLSDNIRADVKVFLNSAADRPDVRAGLRLLDNGQPVHESESTVDIKTGKQVLEFSTGPLKNITLWDTQNPHLYEMELMLGDTLITERFGFRDISFKPEEMCIRDRGYSELYHMYSPDRILHPLKQTGSRGDRQGFRPISWDEAIDLYESYYESSLKKAGRLGYLPVLDIGGIGSFLEMCIRDSS